MRKTPFGALRPATFDESTIYHEPSSTRLWVIDLFAALFFVVFFLSVPSVIDGALCLLAHCPAP